MATPLYYVNYNLFDDVNPEIMDSIILSENLTSIAATSRFFGEAAATYI